MKSFSFAYRNPGHWDVINSEGRIFCIRGDDESGFYIRDERRDTGEPFPRDSLGPYPNVETERCGSQAH